MFPELKKNFIRRITAIIVMIITIPFIALYFSFKISLDKDYAENSKKFHRQIAQTLNMKLSQIENSVNLYIFKYQLKDVFNRASVHEFSVNDLKNIQNYCPDVSDAFIFDTAGSIKYYNNGYVLPDFYRLLSNDSYRSYFFSDTPVWCTFDFDESRESYWIYTVPIVFDEDIPAMYISVLIRSETLNELFNNQNTEYCRNDLFYLYTEQSRDVILRRIQDDAGIKTNVNLINSITNSSSVKDGHITISSYPVHLDSMRLIVISEGGYIMRGFFLLLLGIWGILLVICFFITTKIINQFIFDLQKFCLKVKNYTISKKLPSEGVNYNDKDYDY